MALSSKESAWLGSAHPLPASSLGPLLRFDRCRVQLAGLVAFRDQVAARQRSQRVTTYIGVSDARDTPCPRARGTPSRSPRAPLAPPSRPPRAPPRAPLAPRLALAPPSHSRHSPPSWLGNCVAPPPALVASGDGAFALAAPPALVAPGCTAVVLTAIALPLPLALDPCSCSRRHGDRAPRRGEPPIGELPRAPVASALHRPRSRGHPLPVVASASHQPRSHGHPLPLVASGLHRPRSRGHPLPLWHRRCTAPARTVTLCP